MSKNDTCYKLLNNIEITHTYLKHANDYQYILFLSEGKSKGNTATKLLILTLTKINIVTLFRSKRVCLTIEERVMLLAPVASGRPQRAVESLRRVVS